MLQVWTWPRFDRVVSSWSFPIFSFAARMRVFFDVQGVVLSILVPMLSAPQ